MENVDKWYIILQRELQAFHFIMQNKPIKRRCHACSLDKFAIIIFFVIQDNVQRRGDFITGFFSVKYYIILSKPIARRNNLARLSVIENSALMRSRQRPA